MEQKLLYVLENKVNDRVYRLELPYGAPFGEAYDVCHQFLLEILEHSKKVAEKAKQSEEKEAELVS